MALKWTPLGKMKRGRLKSVWQRSVEAELLEMGVSQGESYSAKDCSRWRNTIDALWASGF